MIGRGTLTWLSLAVVAGVGLFHVSYRVQSLEEELAQVNRDILHEQETIHVLRAEWSYLNEPQRLAELSRRHLTLAPLSAPQMMRIEDLPLRLPPLIAETTPLPDPGPSIQPSSITTTEVPASKLQAPASKPKPPPTSIADLIERTSEQP
jgi:hypothetical protein